MCAPEPLALLAGFHQITRTFSTKAAVDETSLLADPFVGIAADADGVLEFEYDYDDYLDLEQEAAMMSSLP